MNLILAQYKAQHCSSRFSCGQSRSALGTTADPNQFIIYLMLYDEKREYGFAFAATIHSLLGTPSHAIKYSNSIMRECLRKRTPADSGGAKHEGGRGVVCF